LDIVDGGAIFEGMVRGGKDPNNADRSLTRRARAGCKAVGQKEKKYPKMGGPAVGRFIDRVEADDWRPGCLKLG
jgi:hypothetical protein